MNNNNHPSSKARCSCGRYMTLGEDAAGISSIGYKCPTCRARENYEQFKKRNMYGK